MSYNVQPGAERAFLAEAFPEMRHCDVCDGECLESQGSNDTAAFCCLCIRENAPLELQHQYKPCEACAKREEKHGRR